MLLRPLEPHAENIREFSIGRSVVIVYMIMTEHINPIPDDLPACQDLLRAALVRLHDLERQLDEFVATTEELERSHACLKEEYLALKRLLFGPRRERLPCTNSDRRGELLGSRPMFTQLPQKSRRRTRARGQSPRIGVEPQFRVTNPPR
jgi:hypothetical protein